MTCAPGRAGLGTCTGNETWLRQSHNSQKVCVFLIVDYVIYQHSFLSEVDSKACAAIPQHKASVSNSPSTKPGNRAVDGIFHARHTSSMVWQVEFTDELEEWWNRLDGDEPASIAASVGLLEVAGPNLRHPPWQWDRWFQAQPHARVAYAACGASLPHAV